MNSLELLSDALEFAIYFVKFEKPDQKHSEKYIEFFIDKKKNVIFVGKLVLLLFELFWSWSSKLTMLARLITFTSSFMEMPLESYSPRYEKILVGILVSYFMLSITILAIDQEELVECLIRFLAQAALFFMYRICRKEQSSLDIKVVYEEFNIRSLNFFKWVDEQRHRNLEIQVYLIFMNVLIDIIHLVSD